jgi:hypothetical protein
VQIRHDRHSHLRVADQSAFCDLDLQSLRREPPVNTCAACSLDEISIFSRAGRAKTLARSDRLFLWLVF